MLLYQYLTALPPIPAHLLLDAYLLDESKIGFQDGEYTRWALRFKIQEWLNENISNEILISGMQIITGDIPMHCDKRHWALNYIIETGGDAVKTGFHKLPGEPTRQTPSARAWNAAHSEEICSIVLEPFRWHIINTHVLHSVTGVTSTRKAVTLGLNRENPFDDIKNYSGLLASL
jgi:hypothetical protein